MLRKVAILGLAGLLSCDVVLTRHTYAFFPRHVQHFIEVRRDVPCGQDPAIPPAPSPADLAYNEAIVGSECRGQTRVDIHVYMEVDIASVYRHGHPGTLVSAAVYMQPDDTAGCDPGSLAIAGVNFSDKRIPRRDRDRYWPAPTTTVDDEVWSFRRWQTFQGRGDSLRPRLSASGRFVYQTTGRATEEIRNGLLRDDIVTVTLIASDSDEICFERLSPVGISFTFAQRDDA